MKTHHTAEIELDGQWSRRLSVKDGYVRVTLDDDTQIVGDYHDVRETLLEVLDEMAAQRYSLPRAVKA